MRLRSAAAWLLSGILILLLVATGWLWIADLGVLKPKIEQWISNSTGREFSIDGDLSIDLASHSVIVANGVRLQNADWAKVPDMLRIGRVEAHIDLWSLVSGPVIIELLDVDDVEIDLSLVEGREPNWRFLDQGEQAPASGKQSDNLLGIRLPQVDVENLRIHYASFERDAPLDLNIDSLTQTLRDDEWLVFDLDATLNGKPVSVDGEAGTWDSLLAGTNIRFDVSSKLDTLQLTAKGLLDDLRNPRKPSIDFSASAPDIDDLTRLLGIGEEGEGDIALRGSLEPGDGEPLQFSVSGNLGRAEIDGHGAFSDFHTLNDATMKLKMSAPDLGIFLRIAGIHNVRDAPFTADIDIERQGDRFEVRQSNLDFAGAQLSLKASLPEFPHFTGAVVDMDLGGDSIERLLNALGLPPVAQGAFDVGLDVGAGEGDAIDLKLQAETPLGRATVDGNIGREPKYSGSEFGIEIDVPDVSLVAKAHGLETKVPDARLMIAGDVRLAEDGAHLVRPADVRLDEDRVELNGLIAFAPGGLGSRLDIRAHGPNLAELVSEFGPAILVAALPYDIAGTLSIEGAGIRLEKVGGSVGTAEVAVDGVLNPISGLVGSSFSVRMSGPNAEQYTEQFESLRIQPGPFSLSGRVAFDRESVVLRGVKLERPGGAAEIELEIGMPASRRWLDFDVAMNGRDIRDLWHGTERIELLEQNFSAQIHGTRRGELLDVDRLDLIAGDAKVQGTGELHFGGTGQEASLRVAVDVPNVARLASVDGRLLRERALNLQATVTSSEGAIEAHDVSVRLGSSDASGRFRIVPGDRLHADISVHSDSILIEPLFQESEAPTESIAESGDGRIIPDFAVPYELLSRFDAEFLADVGEVQYKDVVLRNVMAEATLKDGVLNVPTSHVEGLSGSLEAQLRLDPARGAGTGYLQMVARDFSLGLLDNTRDSPSTTDWDISIKATGADLRTMLGASNGVVFLRRNGGRISRGNRFLAALYGGVLEEILDTINPFRKSAAYTEIECVVVPGEIIDGNLKSAPASVVSTDKLLVVLRSTVNLKTEELEVGIRTEPRRRSSVSVAELINPYIQVVGTLAAPRLAVDQQGVLLTGGAAVASGGLTILAQGLWSRLTRSSDPCAEAIENGMQELGDRLNWQLGDSGM